MAKKKRNNSRKPTLNKSRIEFIIEDFEKNQSLEKNFDHIYSVENFGYYLTKSNIEKSNKATLATFSRMKNKYKYAYESTSKLYEYKYNYSTGRYFFTECEEKNDNWIFTDYELLSDENIIELRPVWFNTDELLICLNEMKGNGITNKDFEFLKENIKDYNFGRENWNISRKVLSQLENRYIFQNSFYSPYNFDFNNNETISIKRKKCTDGLFRFHKNRLKRYLEYKKLINEYKSTFPKEIWLPISTNESTKRKRLKTFLSHTKKPDYVYKKLTPYSKEYKVLFYLFRKQYSKWQTQQIMKYYLSIVNKMTEPLEDNPVELDENYNLGNDGFGFHGSKIKTSMDDDEIVIEMRDKAWWDEEQEDLEDYNIEERPFETCEKCGDYKYINEKCTTCEELEFQKALLKFEQEEEEREKLRRELDNLIIDFYGIDYEDVCEYSKETNYIFEIDILEYLKNPKSKEFDTSIEFLKNNYHKNLENEYHLDGVYAIYCFLNGEISYNLDKYERCIKCDGKKEINKVCLNCDNHSK